MRHQWAGYPLAAGVGEVGYIGSGEAAFTGRAECTGEQNARQEAARLQNRLSSKLPATEAPSSIQSGVSGDAKEEICKVNN